MFFWRRKDETPPATDAGDETVAGGAGTDAAAALDATETHPAASDAAAPRSGGDRPAGPTLAAGLPADPTPAGESGWSPSMMIPQVPSPGPTEVATSDDATASPAVEPDGAAQSASADEPPAEGRWERVADPAALERELEAGLRRSRGGFMTRLRGFLGGEGAGGPDWDDVEETLIAGDVGGVVAMEVVERARARHDPEGPIAAVRSELASLLVPRDPDWRPGPAIEGGPAVILVVGVNGTGKTTTIGKLAWRYRQDGRRVVLAAADTFRAAAAEQLTEWSRRAGADIVAHAPGADPGAVVYDALDAAMARHADVVIADTAGRLHTKSNLMDELAKIRRIIEKRLPGARPETLFVIDATTGQNGLNQARAFHDTVGLTGIVLTKLDSTAKGGIVFAIEAALGVPVRFVGVGERAEDLLPFDPDAFVEALFA